MLPRKCSRAGASSKKGFWFVLLAPISETIVSFYYQIQGLEFPAHQLHPHSETSTFVIRQMDRQTRNAHEICLAESFPTLVCTLVCTKMFFPRINFDTFNTTLVNGTPRRFALARRKTTSRRRRRRSVGPISLPKVARRARPPHPFIFQVCRHHKRDEV